MTNELKLERTLEQWAKSVPIAMSQMSEAAIMFAFTDAKKDIAALAAEITALEADAERYRLALVEIAAIEDKMYGGDWDEICLARKIANTAMNAGA